MLICDLEDLLKKEGMLKVYDGTAFKKYLHGDGIYEDGVFHNVVDSYGIYKGQEGKYCFFITDSERGIPQYLDVLDSESEACEALYEMISLFKKAYREK